MGSDRARNSWDPRRQWLTPVRQQGRVTLEADENEAERLESEELRLTTLDVVGAAGTPDDGYRVAVPGAATNPAYQVSVGGGTMYVDGVRVYSYGQVDYSTQPDWLHPDGDPLWIDPAAPADAKKRNELIYLLLSEQEVSATEDTALLEVALGGPDTCQRTRLLQRMVRFGTDASECSVALSELATSWSGAGMDLDLATYRLHSQSRLQVSFPGGGGAPDPCEPAAAGGYLKPDNQLIRVQSIDSGDIVWGFDDASFIYRATAVDANTLRLASRPIDSYHRPRNGQVVEVLRTTTQLWTGAEDGPAEASPNDFVANPTGLITTLTKDYDPDTGEIAIADALSLAVQADAVLFVRVWEARAAVVLGTALAIGDTGMDVTLSNAASGKLHTGDAWLLAVRPATPTKVYPERYLDQPQPPDAARIWICPLAIVTWNNGVLVSVADCRNPFEDLVDLTKRQLGGCCDVTVYPADITGNVTLQSIVDKTIGHGPATICLMPGDYSLAQPLRLTSQHANLTIEACHDGAVIQAAAGSEAAFLDGLIVLEHANGITLRGLRLELPLVPFVKAGGSVGGLTGSGAVKALGAGIQNLVVSVGVRAVHAALLTVEGCLFRYALPPGADLVAIGIFANGECWGHAVRKNRFLHEEDYFRTQAGALRALVGYLLAPSVVFGAGQKPALAARVAAAAGRLLPALLTDAQFEANVFDGLMAAALLYGDCGKIDITGNTVRNSESGFWILAMRAAAFANLIGDLGAGIQEGIAYQYSGAVAAVVQHPLVQIASVVARAYPLPIGYDGSGVLAVKASDANPKADLAQMRSILDRAAKLFGTGQPAAAVAATAAPAAPAPAPADAAPAVPAAAPADAAATAPIMEAAGTYADAARVTANVAFDRYAALHQSLTIIERASLAKGIARQRGLQLQLEFSSNDVDVFVRKVLGGSGLLVWDNDERTENATIIYGSNLRSGSYLPTVLLLMTARNSVTGNVIANQGIRSNCLMILPIPTGQTALTAVTGNVLVGRPLLPPRNLPAPLDTWDVFNAVS